MIYNTPYRGSKRNIMPVIVSVGVIGAPLIYMVHVDRRDEPVILSKQPITVVHGKPIASNINYPRKVTDTTSTDGIYINGDGATILDAFARERVDPTWASNAKSKIERSMTWPEGVKIRTIECRLTMCGITGTVTEAGNVNIDAVLSAIEGSNADKELSSAGFIGQKSAVYTMLSDSPLQISFTRVVQEVSH